jgi:hydroxymethylglutaryl-CoA lyase
MKPANLHIVEVGPRDGLQNLSVFVPTDRKADLIRRLAACGVREIQAGAFVNPRAIPQFRDMKEVMADVCDLRDCGVVLSTLVPNLQGARDAVEAGVSKLDFFFSVSRSHNLNNVRQTPEESLAALRLVLGEFDQAPGLSFRVNLATVFGCPFEGYLETAAILEHVEKTARLGIRVITLCDTVGWGYPAQVEAILKACLAAFPEVAFGVHLHNTRGLGLANALKAWETGIRVFDSALGGLGGCPFAPGPRETWPRRTSCSCSSPWESPRESTWTGSSKRPPSCRRSSRIRADELPLPGRPPRKCLSGSRAEGNPAANPDAVPRQTHDGAGPLLGKTFFEQGRQQDMLKD